MRLSLVDMGSFSSTSSEDDFLIRKIVLTHDHDGRYLDSELLFQVVQNVMSSVATTADVSSPHNDGSNIEVVGSEETLEHILCKISREMLLKCSDDGYLHVKTMVLFDMLGYYTWDAKVVLVLAALASSYGESWLIMQRYPYNQLAVSDTLLKHSPSDSNILRIRFKALSLLVNTMVELAKCVIKFEGLPVKDVLLGDEAIVLTKSQIYMATYWIFKGSLECSSHIADFIAIKQEKNSQSTTIAAWGLSNMVSNLRRLCNDLKKQVDLCHQQIETKSYKKLLDLSEKPHEDNQEIIEMLFALKDEMPLRDCSSQTQVNISELTNKVVIILVSRPELLLLDQIHLLVQKTYNYPYNARRVRSYEVVWVPIPASDTWTFEEKRSFSLLSNSVPWLCIRKPWLLSSAVVNFIKQEWNYKDHQPLMLVLDSQGTISNLNAMDMVFIWGPKAFPFSTLKEKQLWEEQKWSVKLMLDNGDSSLLKLMEEGRGICLYGSDDIDWIKQFNSRIDKIRTAGVLNLEVINIGKKNATENVPNNLASTDKANLYDPQNFINIKSFWHRLESIKRSILHVGNAENNHRILKDVLWLLEMVENSKSWVLIGNPSSEDVIKLEDMGVMECLDLYPTWGKNVGDLGLISAIKAATEAQLLDAL